MNGKIGKIFMGGILALLLLLIVNIALVRAEPVSQSYNCAAQTALSVDQCEALVAIYEETSGENWVNNSGWLVNDDPCQWFGVSCHEGAVVALDLYGNRLEGSLPLEIGGFPEMKTLTLNDNPLSGPIPLTITFMDLDLFHFHNTSLCEPADPNFQDWLSQIVYRISTDQSCSPPVPTDTPTPIRTQGSTPADEVPWPEQTLTALAQNATREAVFASTSEPTATKYYTLETPTATVEEEDQGVGDENQGTGGNDAAAPPQQSILDSLRGFLSEIPRGWLLLLLVPVVLIILGIFLEMRDRRKEEENRPKMQPLEYIDYEE